jgi:hypothetical protein
VIWAVRIVTSLLTAVWCGIAAYHIDQYTQDAGWFDLALGLTFFIWAIGWELRAVREVSE